MVYQSPAPSQLVTIALDDVTPQEALIRLFDGQGLNYIFQLDATGSKVAMLIVARAASTRTASSSGSSSHSAPVPQPQIYNEEEAPPEDEQPEGDEEVMEQPPPEEVVQPEQAEPQKGLSGSSWTPPGVMAPPTTFPGAMPIRIRASRPASSGASRTSPAAPRAPRSRPAPAALPGRSLTASRLTPSAPRPYLGAGARPGRAWAARAQTRPATPGGRTTPDACGPRCGPGRARRRAQVETRGLGLAAERVISPSSLSGGP